jgi:hypothetical protein
VVIEMSEDLDDVETTTQAVFDYELEDLNQRSKHAAQRANEQRVIKSMMTEVEEPPIELPQLPLIQKSVAENSATESDGTTDFDNSELIKDLVDAVLIQGEEIEKLRSELAAVRADLTVMQGVQRGEVVPLLKAKSDAAA